MLRALRAGHDPVPADSPLRVLLIEDNRADARLIQELLAERRSEIVLELVSYLAAGLAVLEKGGVDLVLADLTLPDSRGLETVETLVARAPEVPLVVLTGVSDEALAARALRTGAQDYLVKGEVEGPLLARSLRYALERKRVESALERSHERLRALFDNALDAILLADDEGRYVDANPAAEALTGYSREELLGLTASDLTRATDQENRSRLWETFVDRGSQRGEYVVVRKNGTEAHVAYRAVANIQPGLHLSFLDDLSEKRRAEDEKRKQAEHLRLVLGQLPVGIWTTDRQLIIRSATGAGLRDVGIDAEGFVGSSLLDVIGAHDEGSPPIRAHVEALKGKPASYETSLHDRHFEVHVEPFRDRVSSIIGVLGVALDVTDRQSTEAALRESEERYRRFFEEDLTGDAIATPDGTLVTCNSAFVEIFGYASVDEALGATLPDLFPDRDLRRDFLRRIRREGKLERFEMEGRRRNGEPVHIIANVIGTFDGAGELVDFRGYLFDDTDRHQAEEQLRQAQKMEAVGRLAGGVAHDFNNLVTAITGYSDLLLARCAPDDPDRRELQEIRRAGERAAALTRQLLAFSRSQVMRPEVLDLNEVVAGTEAMLRRLLGEDVRLVTRLAREAGHVRTDRGQLEQVIVNLVVNSRDAMPRGGTLTLETADVELGEGFARRSVVVQPGRYAMLTVSDTGEGMPPEVVERVFEPFFTTKDPGKGTGLGLSTAYGIVKQSGGYIFASSEPGTGTTFKVYLPWLEGAREAVVAQPAAAHGSAQGETILVVEDEEAVRRLIVQILRLRGYRVLEAPCGREAMELCRGGDPVDLVITDLVMPDMGGTDLGEALARLYPATEILYISGYPGSAIARRGELPEGTAFLQKPFTQDDLVGKVRELLD